MVRIILRESKGKLRGISIDGHADAGKFGEDVVCAGISVLSQAILLGILSEVSEEVPHEIASGHLTFDLPKELSMEEGLKAEALMNTLKLGIINLKEGYSKYIEITKEEV